MITINIMDERLTEPHYCNLIDLVIKNYVWKFHFTKYDFKLDGHGNLIYEVTKEKESKNIPIGKYYFYENGQVIYFSHIPETFGIDYELYEYWNKETFISTKEKLMNEYYDFLNNSHINEELI